MIIRHSISGRLRIKSDALRGADTLARRLENRLRKMDGIFAAEVRSSTGSIILHYDAQSLPAETMPDLAVSELKKIIREFRSHPEFDEKMFKKPVRETRSGLSMRYYLANTLWVGTFLGYALLRKYILKSPLPQKVLSLSGFAAAVGAIPLLWGTLHELSRKKRPGLLSFLTTACMLAVLAGEIFTALEIIWLLSFGLYLEEYVKEQAHRAISDILRLAPEKTVALINGIEREIAVSDLKQKTTIVVRTGGRIPADGTIVYGKALIDEAHITGRSFPELRQKNDSVWAGTQVQQGTVHIRAEKVGKDTYLARITDLVETSLAQRSESERKADILAARLVKFGWGSTLGTLFLTGSLSRAISVMLVMSCPCATVLAASTAVSAGIANAARRNILIRGGTYLEKFKDVQTVCFDKTGTITLDTPQVVDIVARDARVKPDALLMLAASAEAESNHPIAKALMKAARERNIVIVKPKSSKTFIGRGIRAEINSDTILIGNADFLKSQGIKTDWFKDQTKKHMAAGCTTLLIAKNLTIEGLIALANTVRPEAAYVLNWLKSNGIRNLYLISGDSASGVNFIAKEQPFDDFASELLPEAKAQFIERLTNQNRHVMMVGDGINDAPALSKATIGVAMGAGGSEVAIASADIALADSDLMGLVTLKQLSEQTHRVIEINFWLATASNIVGVILGFAGRFSPVMAGIFHVGHSLGIMANSGRLLNWVAPETKFRQS